MQKLLQCLRIRYRLIGFRSNCPWTFQYKFSSQSRCFLKATLPEALSSSLSAARNSSGLPFVRYFSTLASTTSLSIRNLGYVVIESAKRVAHKARLPGEKSPRSSPRVPRIKPCAHLARPTPQRTGILRHSKRSCHSPQDPPRDRLGGPAAGDELSPPVRSSERTETER